MAETRPQPAALDARVVLPIVLLIVTVAYLWAALGIRSPYQDVGVGPSFFPIVIVCCMVPALLWVLVDGIRAARSGVAGERHSIADPAKIVGLTGLYVALFVPLGYAAATMLYVLGLFLVFDPGTKSPLRRVAMAIAITAAGYALFRLAFGVRLPTFLGLDLPL